MLKDAFSVHLSENRLLSGRAAELAIAEVPPEGGGELRRQPLRMKLSLFSDYALRVLMYGALKGAPFQLDEVTDAYGISRHHLGKVVNRLARLGYLDTQRGRRGGIRLSLDPASIRIGQLLRKTEDQPVFVECFDPAANRCPVAGSCRLKGFLAEAILDFYRSLDRHSLKDLVEGPHLEAMRLTLLSGTPSPATGEVHPGESPSS